MVQIFERPELAQVEDLTLKLARAHNELKLAEQERTNMLANISHDLRAPLTALRSSIDYLHTFQNISDVDEKELTSILYLMDKRTKTLELLVQDLFYLTSLANIDKAFHFESIDLVPFLEEYYYEILEDGSYVERNMILDFDPKLQAYVSCDPQHMYRVLDNLYTNALKYSTKSATIKLHAQLVNTAIQVSIEDTGIGIPSESIDKIFTRSYTVSSARTPNSPTGSGLGLAIVKQIIQAHNGSVWCKSTLGKGSCFTFELPLIIEKGL